MFKWGWISSYGEDNKLDVIVLRYLNNASMKKASKWLARDITKFFEECSGEVEWVLRMSRAVYVDTSRTVINGKKKRKPHYVYDGEKTFEVDKLTKLKDVDEVLDLLKRGVKHIHRGKRKRI